ncbi:MAG: hypothetical protein II828_08670 [Clostridia bacterium]|nr:hypothetical protein [Clostridia bacterium]
MANNPHYRDLMRQARRDHLVNIRQVSGQIASLYEDAAKDLSSQAASMKKRTLSHRWATEYADALDKRARELRAGLYDVTYQGLKRSANLPIAADGDFWEAVGGQSFRDMFAVTPDDILTNLITGQIYQDNKGLSDRIWTASKTFEHDIDYMVNRGIAEHKSAYELAKDLEQYVKPKAKRDWDWGRVYPHLAGKQIDYNAQRLARTAINHSYFLANQKVCVQNPYVEVMHWELSDAHLFRQVIPFGPDECDDYAEHDEGFGMGNWTPNEIPLPHPQCLCVQYGVVPESLEVIGDEIGRWIAGESVPRLDRWNALYGQNYDRQIPSVWDLKNAADGGRIVSGGLNPDSDEAEDHAKRYYASVRKMSTDVRRIAENTGFDEDLIHSIKSFVFLEKHDLGEGRYDYFDASYLMAQSWQRLIDGKNILLHDITLLRHEKMERELMAQGLSQKEAHDITSEVYNYSKEAREYYGEIEKHKKK